MTETPPDPVAPGVPAQIPEALAVPKARRPLPVVWLIPLVAALVGGWLAAKTILERGATITIAFASAEGIEPGKTRIKYKHVDVGQVTTVALARDGTGVLVTAEMVKEVDPYLVEDTRFWVVRPRIAGGQVSGLGTLLSGSYIGMEPGHSGEHAHEFTALKVAPIVTGDLPGRQFVLRTPNLGSLDIGFPVYFRRIQVGQILAYELDEDGTSVTLKVFIHAPYDRHVGPNTRFWQASGIDLSVGASGVSLQTEGLFAVALGGIAFETPAGHDGEAQAVPNTEYLLFEDRAAAMRQPDTRGVRYAMVFNESVRGLAVGAPVDFRGIPLGEVLSIEVELDAKTNEIRIPVEVVLFPDRLRARNRGDAAPQDPKAVVDALVAQGFRAQLRPGNLLTGQLFVTLDVFPNARKVAVDWSADPPVLPTVPGNLAQIEATLMSVAKKLDALPVEQIAAELRQSLASLDRLLASADKAVRRVDDKVAPEVAATLQETRETLAAAKRAMKAATDSTLAADSALQAEAREALRELTRAAQSLRSLTDYLERHPESLIRGKQEQPQ